MLETIMASFIIAKIKGYKLKPLFKSWEIYTVLGFELMYVIMQLSVFMGNYSFIKYAGLYKTLYLYSFFFLIFKYKLYISAIIGSGFIIIGTVLNKIAIAANNGFMPVFPTLSYFTGYVSEDAFSKIKDIHVLGNEATKLKFLTDVIDIGYSILSIGDIFIRLFVFVIIYSAIKHLNKADT
jgi:hypothetical protein